MLQENMKDHAAVPDLETNWIDACLQRAAPHKPFLVVDGAALSYGNFEAKLKKLTGVLTEVCDPERGLAIVTNTAAEMACLFLAALRAGLPVININPDLTPSERAHALRASGVSCVFLDRAIRDQAPVPAGMRAICIENTVQKPGLVGRLLRGQSAEATEPEYIRLLADAAPVETAAPVDPDRTAMLLMTSGTTSAPKIVELSHRNILAQLDVFAQVYALRPEARLLNPLPLHFTDGILHGPVHALFAGATLYRPARFRFDQIEDLLVSIYRDRITHFFAVPTLLAMIADLPAAFDDAFDTEDFDMIRSSGDRLPDALWGAFEERFGVQVSNAYGLSETVCEAVFCVPRNGTYSRGTIGKPVGCSARIVTPDGTEAEPDVAGELELRGDIIAKGYRENQDATEKAFADGWFKTGDLAKMDADGYLTVTGRCSGLIISGGMNINPLEISDALLGHDAVADAAVVGVEDPVFGEKVVAAITLRDTTADHTKTTNALFDLCRHRLAPHKVPRDIRILEQIPRTPSGKVVVAHLRETIQNARSTEAKTAVCQDQDIIELAAGVFNCDAAQLSLDAEPKSTIGWDSFAHVQLILEAENRYGVTIPPREFLAIKTLRDLAKLLEKRCA